MNIPALVLHVSHSAALAGMYVTGIVLGLVMFLYGLRPSHKEIRPKSLPQSKRAVSPDGVQPRAQSPASNVQIIRLSRETGTLKSADMTQQQKIAAALLKAGISNSASWTNAEGDPCEDRSKVQVMTAAPEPSAHATFARSTPEVKVLNRFSPLKKLMLWAGPALALLSLYLLLRFKSLL